MPESPAKFWTAYDEWVVEKIQRKQQEPEIVRLRREVAALAKRLTAVEKENKFARPWFKIVKQEDGLAVPYLDNYGAHKHPKVRAWRARHPRFAFHFTPTSCSWLNAIETFFAKLTRRRLKRGTFRSIVDLQAAINRFIAAHNHDPKPFVWTADPNRILESVRRGHQTLETIH